MLLGAALNLIPNDTHPGWYAIPEIACDLVTSDQDQWRCDEDPVAWRRFEVPQRLFRSVGRPGA
jgi:hypothetical protein